jgi:formamidopyrimidine-DNA glycosylase
LYNSAQFQAKLGPGRLGPDALTISVEEMRARLARSRRAIKVALLDQKAIAGIGNLYASEILHLAGIHPEKQCHRIPLAAWHVVHAAMNEVLRTAITYEGSTLADGTYRNALNQAGSFQNHHRVYNRADLPCPRCQDAVIVRIVQAQRSTFFCQKCQHKRLSAG